MQHRKAQLTFRDPTNCGTFFPNLVNGSSDYHNGVIQRMPDPEWERLNLLDSKMDELNESIAHLQKHIEELHREQHESDKSIQ